MGSSIVSIPAQTWVRVSGNEFKGFIRHKSGGSVIYVEAATEPVALPAATMEKTSAGDKFAYYSLATGEQVWAYAPHEYAEIVKAPVLDEPALTGAGLIYDPSDFSTLFQDSAGTIPVTGPEQPVGLMLDKSGNGNHAFQETNTKRPILKEEGGLYYLKADGVDDFMETAPIDWGGADRMLVMIGVKKLSDTPRGVLSELGVVQDGSFTINMPDTGEPQGFVLNARGTSTVAVSSGPELPAPSTAVIRAHMGINVPFANVSINGIIKGSSTASQGSGAYGAYPLYLLMRAGTSLPFNGNFYGAVIASGIYDTVFINTYERYLAEKSGVLL